ncbi:MAG: selenocysteine-specific translation elongation factor [Termitinemataceae bacterium]|nr:MAG: selenocysteine-specific translation elongation factor [Termitinemataceae bacterium]
MEYPFIFGTAGHIDHGKTALVLAMTGVDCDRLDEEKRRGITIELGFAPLNLPNGKTVSVIDVPGHERFIRQMAAGAAGMDAAMLVIAASEGVMPQTREHLDILDLLGVRFGLVALTKKDLVDDETLELATAEVLELTKGTCLEGAPIIPVSAKTGDGVPLIIAEIERIIDKIPARTGAGAFFMPIDRVFIKKGFGAVVTGTSYQGMLSESDEVDIMPAGIVGRVRSLQTHGVKVNSVSAGQRVAINISGVSNDLLERGASVCARGAFIATDCINAYLNVLSGASSGVMHRQRVRLHIGTSDIIARISLLRLGAQERKTGISAGHSAAVQILCESKIAVAAGQHFVIRFYSPLITIGGGRVILPNAKLAHGKAEREFSAQITEAACENFDPIHLLATIIADNGIISNQSLLTLSQMDKNAASEALKTLSASREEYGILEFGAANNFVRPGVQVSEKTKIPSRSAGGIFITLQTFNKIAKSVLRILHEFHAAHPELSGLEAEKLYAAAESVHASTKISVGDFKGLVAMMASQNLISPVFGAVPDKVSYKAADHRDAPLDDKFTGLVLRARKMISDAGFNLLTLPNLQEKLGASIADTKKLAAYLREQDDLRTIEGGALFSREMREALLKVLKSMSDDISVAGLRDVIGVNRKESLAMLDFMDAQGFTKRDGNKRILKC